MTKQTITVEVDSIKDQLDGLTIERAVSALIQLGRKYGPNAIIDIGQEYEPYGDSQYAYVKLMARREETDEEYTKRLAQEKHYADQRAAADLAAYERVKKSLEGKV